MNLRGMLTDHIARPTPVLAFVLACTLLSSCALQADSADVEAAKIVPQISDQDTSEETEHLLSEYVAQIEEKLPFVEAIARLGARDQYVRQSLAQSIDTSRLSAEQGSALQLARANHMAKIDEANTLELKGLLENISWREIADAGGGLIFQAFFVVQHSPDLEFQASVLEALEPLVEEGLFDSQQYVYLYDRVQLRKGQRQRYGTQLNCVDGVLDVADLEAPESVDERRAKAGLQPLSEYIAFAKQNARGC